MILLHEINKKMYGITFDFFEQELLNLKSSLKEITDVEQTLYTTRRLRHLSVINSALFQLMKSVNDESKELIIRLYIENESFEVISKQMKIKKSRLQFRHKVFVDELLEIIGAYTGPNRRYSNGKRRRSIPTKVKETVKKRDKNKCVVCANKDNLHFHHKTRYADGGQDTVDNLILLCVTCHAEEHKNENAYHMLKKQSERTI